MSEMIERAARALYDCERQRSDLADEVVSAASGKPVKSSMEPWEEVADLYRSDARAAIEAIREPKGAMIAAGGRLSQMKDPALQNLNAMAIYRAMITRLLGP
jgi:hypothetical protein